MKRLRMMKDFLVVTLIFGVFILSGCAGETGNGHWDKPPSPLASLAVTPAASSIPIAGFQQLAAIATYEDGTTRDVTTSSSWLSATTVIATVTPTSGVAVGVSSGTSDITATYKGMSDTVTLTVNAATLMSLVVTPVPASIPVGGTQQFTARAIYSDGNSFIVTEGPTTVWSAENAPLGGAAVATLSTNGVLGAGLATGNTPGTSAITAAFGGKTDTVTLTVNNATLVSIVVTPDLASIPVNGSQKFTAMATYSYGLPVNVTENAGTVWTATNLPLGGAPVATLSPNGLPGAGLATGATAGTATINATYGTLSDSATLTVNDATLVSILVTPNLASIPVNGTQQYTAIATYSFGPPVDVTEDPATIWTAVNAPLGGTAVATLSPNGLPGAGLATGQVAGTSTITATFGTQNDTATLTVNDATLVSIMVTPALASIPVNGTQQYLAIATYSFGPPIDVTEDPATIWTATNSPLGGAAVATLSASGILGAGLATGAVAGTSTITATFGTQNDSAILTVTAGPVPVVPLAVNLRGAASFGIASQAGLTSTGVTVVNGDVALYPLAGCTDSTGNAGASQDCLVKTYSSPTGMTVNGSIYWAGDPFDNGGTANSVTNDLNIAWTEAMNKVEPVPPVTVAGDQMDLQTFFAGVYHNGNLGLAAGGVTTLDAQNDANAIFIFKVDLDFVDSGTLALPSQIILANGAQARNVWFVTGRDITIGSGTTWFGNILAGRDVTVNSGSTVLGRVLGGASGAGAFVLTGAASPSVTTITVPE